MPIKTPTSGLELYSGPWTRVQARHLLSRSVYGVRSEDLDNFTQLGVVSAVQTLLSSVPPDKSLPKVNRDFGPKETAPLHTTWVHEANSAENASRRQSFYAWWVDQTLRQGLSIQEKMALFFYNHMPAANSTFGAIGLYEFHQIYRQKYLGNLKDILKEITISFSMLQYLNGNSNRAEAPNENHARELLELFTIGKGPLIEDGNYTHYTEEDVIQAAKVLSGWRTNFDTSNVYFQESQHNTEDKQFSSAFQNKVISNQGMREYETLINMIFQQKETARHFCRKLYRFFVHYKIDATIETNIIEPLATILYSNNYELKPVYEALFSSAHFYDSQVIGGVIKHPLEFILGLTRTLRIPLPPSMSVEKNFIVGKELRALADGMGMKLGHPPSVAGWTAYYSQPLFHRRWIHSSSLGHRSDFTRWIQKGILIEGNSTNFELKFDPKELSNHLMNSQDVKITTLQVCELLLPKTPPQSTLKILETSYQSGGLTELVKQILNLAEFQLH